MRSRLLPAVLAAALLFAGCGTATDTPTEVPGPSALASATGPVTVTLWHTFGGVAAEAFTKQVAAFNAAHAGKIELQAVYQGSYADALAKYTAALRSGGTPNILSINDITSGFMRDAGQTVAAQDLAAANPGDLDLNSLRPAARGYYTAEGKLLAVPVATSMPLLYVNDALLAKAGVDRTTLGTLDGVAAAARAVKQATGVAGLVQPFDGWYPEQLTAASGQTYCSPGNGREAGGATALTLAPATRAAIGTVASLYRDGVGLDTGTDPNAAVKAFTAGQVAMMVNSSGSIGAIRQAGLAGWSALPYPLSGDRASSGALIGGAALWVNGPGHSAAEQVASWKVVSFLASPAFQLPFSQASGYAPVATAVDADPAEKAFLAANPAYDVLRRQFADTPAVPATAGCLSGAMSGIRREVVSRMQAAYSGAQPVDAALTEAEQAATQKITDYRKQAGQ